MSIAIDCAEAGHDARTRRPWTSCEGVTLIEVLAAIFIMGVGLLAMLTLFPVGALSMRRAVNEDRAGTSLGALAAAASQFEIVHGNPPGRLSDLTIFLSGDDRYEDGEDGGYSFTLESAGLMAIPAAPGKTGLQRFCIRNGGTVFDCTDPTALRQAEEARALMEIELLSASLQTTVSLIDLVGEEGALNLVRRYLAQLATNIVDYIDQDDDGLIALYEILSIRDPLLATYLAEVGTIVEAGAGDEDLRTLPGVDLSQAPAGAADFLTFTTLRALTAFYVTNHGVVQALTAKLDAAEAATNRGNDKTGDAILRAFAHQLAAQSGRSLSPTEAAVLILLAALQ